MDQRNYQLAINEALIEADKGVFISGRKVLRWLRELDKNPNAAAPQPDIFKKKPASF